ncbi:MAG: hypothetical protein O7B25_11045 [Gammaproteobacteria bacterium]|nr:hypothetical protein [Gammaproteobacteria bacterium]
MNIAKYLFAVLLMAGLAACGQGGGGSEKATGSAPMAADDGDRGSMDLDTVVEAAEAAADEVAEEAGEMAAEMGEAIEEMAEEGMDAAAQMAGDLPDL